MTTTTTWLQTKSTAELSFALVFDGYDLIYCTRDASGIATAWSGTDWSTVKVGLDIAGEMAQEIEAFDPRVDTDTLTFRISDIDGTFRTTLIKGSGGTPITRLAATADANDTDIEVEDITDFPSSGTIYIGQEKKTYTGTTPATVDDNAKFTGCTGGKNSIFEITGGGGIGRRHRIGDSYKVTGRYPRVTSSPANFWNKKVALYVHHKEAGVWSTRANAELLWAGRIGDIKDNGDGSFSLSCISIQRDLQQALFDDQFVAEQKTGLLIDDDSDGIQVYAKDTNIPSEYFFQADALTNSTLRHDEIISDINEQFNTWRLASNTHANHRWYCEVRQTPDGPRFVIGVWVSSSVVASSVRFTFGMHPEVWDWLGLDVPAGAGTSPPMGIVELEVVDSDATGSGTIYEKIGAKAPKLFRDLSDLRLNSITNRPSQIAFENDRGTWVPQNEMPMTVDSRADGFIKYGDQVFAVAYDSGNSRFDIYHRFGALKHSDPELGIETPTIRLGDGEIPTIKQIWIERGKAGTILLQSILSTGSSGYNHGTYDVYGGSLGLGIPAGEIDIQSFESMEGDFELYLEEPTSFAEILEPALAAHGRYLVFTGGKLQARWPGFELASASDIITITEAAKPDVYSRARVTYSRQGIINAVTLKMKRSNAGIFSDADSTITVVNEDSIDSYETRRAVQIDGRGILDEAAFVEHVATPVMSYFGRPMAVIEYPINANFAHVRPGDLVKLTDNNIVDPTTGTRGISGLAAWVQATSFDWSTGQGTLALGFMPEHDASRYALLGPSCLVDDTAPNGGLDAATLTVFTCYPYRFSKDTETTTDPQRFTAGDKIRIFETDKASPVFTWSREVASVTATTLTVTSAIGTPAWSSNRQYIIEFEDKSTVVSAQTNRAYIANSDNMSTGAASEDANFWAMPGNSEISKFASTTTDSWTYETYDTQRYAAGEPLSIHKLWLLMDYLNNHKRYTTRQQLVSQSLTSPIQRTNGVSNQWSLAWGPVLLPMYSCNVLLGSTNIRDLRCKVLLRTVTGGNTARARVVTSNARVTGSSLHSLTYSGPTAATSQMTTTSTSLVWTSETTVTPVIGNGSPPYTWLWVEVANSSGVIRTELGGVSVVEEE